MASLPAKPDVYPGVAGMIEIAADRVQRGISRWRCVQDLQGWELQLLQTCLKYREAGEKEWYNVLTPPPRCQYHTKGGCECFSQSQLFS